MTTRIVMLVFPDLDQLDLTGPFEVLSRLPGAQVQLAWKKTKPIRDNGWARSGAGRQIFQAGELRRPGGAGRAGPAGPDGG